MMIRHETPDDIDTIRHLTYAAFKDVPYSDQTEALIVGRLREAYALSLSLVAVDEGSILGHVAFSPVTINGKDENWYGMGPVSVWPEHQGTGVGSALIETGLEELRDIGGAGCVVLGDPGYYGRFGFTCMPDLKYPHAPAEYFQALAFEATAPKGEVEYHAAFTIE